MRRLARYTLNALTALSLLLCVATVALWVRGYSVIDSAALPLSPRFWCAVASGFDHKLRFTWVEDRREGPIRPWAESVRRADQQSMRILMLINSPVYYDQGVHSGRSFVTGTSYTLPFPYVEWEYRYWA